MGLSGVWFLDTPCWNFLFLLRLMFLNCRFEVVDSAEGVLGLREGCEDPCQLNGRDWIPECTVQVWSLFHGSTALLAGLNVFLANMTAASPQRLGEEELRWWGWVGAIFVRWWCGDFVSCFTVLIMKLEKEPIFICFRPFSPLIPCSPVRTHDNP